MIEVDEDENITLMIAKATAYCNINSQLKFQDILASIENDILNKRPSIAIAENLTSALYSYLFYLNTQSADNLISQSTIEKFILLNSKIYSQLLEKQSTTFKKDKSLAYLIAGLRYFGASKGQSIKSISLWAGIGCEKIEKAYSKFSLSPEKHIKEPPEFIIPLLVSGAADIMYHFKDRDFPSSKPRKGYSCTKESYQKLHEALIDYIENPEYVILEQHALFENPEKNIWEK